MKQTPNYNLPQFEANDKFYKEILNEAYDKIDTAISDLQETVNNASGNAGATAQEVVEARGGEVSLKKKLDTMDSQISDIAQINLKSVGFINDGVTDNSAISSSFVFKSNSKILIPNGTYLFNNSGFALKFISLDNLIIEGNATLIVKDEGIKFEKCNNIIIGKGIKLTRSTQALFGANKSGISIIDCSNVTIDGNDISKFTDNISINANTKTNNVTVKNNSLHRCSEEPVATRKNCSDIYISNNKIFEHLGDGILVKGSKNVVVKENTLTNACNVNSPFYAEMTIGVPSPPKMGGGITCNAEDGAYFTEDYNISNNHLENILYGVGLMACKGSKISNNTIKNVDGFGISITGKDNFNPYNNVSKDIIISGNTIDTIKITSKSSAIKVISTAEVPLTNIQIINNNLKPSNETTAHDGINAYGEIIVSGNNIDDYDYAISCKDGTVVSNNICKTPNSFGTGKQAIAVRGKCIVSCNRIKSESVILVCAINIWTDSVDNIITGNTIEYNGTGSSINFANGAINNILNDNKIALTSTGFKFGGTNYALLNIIDGIRKATSIPTIGTFEKGDRVINSSPTIGNPKSWVCTVSGTPGTWVSEGNL